MKILLDENLPKKLKQHFPDHQVYTVVEMGWKGKLNGELMQLMTKEGFDLLVTFDKNLKYQQNLSRYKITVFVLSAEDNSYQSLTPLIPTIKYELSRLKHSTVVTIQRD